MDKHFFFPWQFIFFLTTMNLIETFYFFSIKRLFLQHRSKRSRTSQTPMMLNYEMKQTRQTLRKGHLFSSIDDTVFDRFMVREVFVVHVGGTRCVTWSIDQFITWGVELILAIFFIFFFDV